MNIDVILNPAEIATLVPARLQEASCIVFDVLRATSSITMALAHGAEEIYPVRTIEEALSLQKKLGGAVLAGERGGDRIDGFDFGNSPLEFRENVPSRIITTTTNGTIALRSCDGAAEVLAGALLNLGAIAAHLLVIDCPIAVLLCAGTGTEAALEDILAAGMLCSRFPDAHLSDAAQAARAVYERYAGAVLEGLLASKNGRALIEKGRRQEVEWCAQTSTCTVVGRLQEGVVRPFPVPLEG